MIGFIMFIVIMILNSVTWYYLGKSQGKYEILEKMLEDEERNKIEEI